ncbi:MAG: hypothetical protein J0M11_03905 [Anaerolineae bacterium]|nr:hypothetical protein [Anaerolineae bacterium]
MSEKKQKGHDYSTLLIWSAAVVTVVRYAAAFIASDMGIIEEPLSTYITWGMGLSGLGMGILDVIGGTYLFDGWRRNLPRTGEKMKPRFVALSIFVFSLMATGVMILVPFTEARVTHTSMSDVLGTGFELTWWALLVNLAPYLLIGGVAIGNQVVNVHSESVGNLPETFRNPSGSGAEPSAKLPGNWRQVRKTLTEDQVRNIAIDQTRNIAFNFKIDERTARNWRKYAQEEVKSATTTAE